MATFDQPSDLLQRIAYPTIQKPARRGDSRIATLPATQKQVPDAASLMEKHSGDIFYFIEPRPRNSWAALGSMTFLLAFVAALIIVPLYLTDPLPKREILTKLYLQPPAAAAAAAVSVQAPVTSSTPTYTPKTVLIPNPVRKMEEAPTAPTGGISGGIIGGVPGGVVGGIPGGVLTGVLNSEGSVPVPVKASEPVPVKRIRVASGVVEANLIHDVPPAYPPEAGRQRIEGIVVLLAVIGRDGIVQDVRVESGLPVLAQAAIDAVKQWRYRPYIINGEPVEVDSRITINFTLSAS